MQITYFEFCGKIVVHTILQNYIFSVQRGLNKVEFESIKNP